MVDMASSLAICNMPFQMDLYEIAFLHPNLYLTEVVSVHFKPESLAKSPGWLGFKVPARFPRLARTGPSWPRLAQACWAGPGWLGWPGLARAGPGWPGLARASPGWPGLARSARASSVMRPPGKKRVKREFGVFQTGLVAGPKESFLKFLEFGVALI